jgi:dihydrofolate reductase
MKPTICAIVATGPYDVIGCDNRMPWHSAQDFYHFRHTTMGFPCVFGKNTFLGIGNRPLQGRLNIICSSKYNDKFMPNGCFYASCIESAIQQSCSFDKVFICGGASVYEYVFDMDLIDVFYLTKIYNPDLAKNVLQNPQRYTFFPKNTDTYFTTDKWQSEQIIYPINILPPEKTPTVSTFFKYTRIR